MRDQGGGKIVNIASGRFWMGGPNRLDYSGLEGRCHRAYALAGVEVGQHNICVNAITPGFHVERHASGVLGRLRPDQRAAQSA